MITVSVSASENYNVLIGRGILADVGKLCADKLKNTKKILVVSDSNVTPLYTAKVKKSFTEAGFETYTLTFEAGEENKTLETFGNIAESAARLGFCRADAFAALGGGVTGDITGFAAACYMRGIKYVQIPTTLLAAIDSSVGGKTGVDLPEGKNLVGAFHQPSAVVFDPEVLSTLPEKELRNGLGEGIKYAVLKGGKIKEIMQSGLNSENLEEFCALCVKYKSEIVSRDEKENGVRQLLNLGHTLGHAEEKLSGYKISHGEAVACGIYIMAKASKNKGTLSERAFEEIVGMLEKTNLLREPEIGKEALVSAAATDKKNRADGLNVVTVRDTGDCRIEKMSLKELGEYIK